MESTRWLANEQGGKGRIEDASWFLILADGSKVVLWTQLEAVWGKSENPVLEC